MTSQDGATSRRKLEPADATYRLLLSLYPSRWQERHGDEALAMLVDRSAESPRARIGDAVDLVWHALTAQLDTAASPVLDRLPRSVRPLPAIIVLSVGAIASVIMLVGEIAGALARPAQWDYATMPINVPLFMSGPFLTIGVGIDIGFILGVILVLAGRTGGGRVVLLGTTIYALWLTWPTSLILYPQPPEIVTGAMALVGVIAILALGDDRLSGRDRRTVGLITLAGSGVALGAILAITGSIGWAPLAVIPFTDAYVRILIAAAWVAVPLLVISIAILVSAIKHRQYGALVLLTLFFQLATLLDAIQVNIMGLHQETKWYRPLGCFVLLVIMIGLLWLRTAVASVRPQAD